MTTWARGHRASGVALGAVLLALAGCARDTPESLRARLEPLVGIPVSELVRRMGSPERVTPLDGPPPNRTRMDYRVVWPVERGRFEPAPVGLDRPTGPTCDIHMFTRDDVVTSFEFSGQACGWGNVPRIRP